MKCCLGCKAQTHWMWSSAAWGEAESCCLNRGREGSMLQSPTSHCWIFYLSAHLSVQAGDQWLQRKWSFCHRKSWHRSNILQHYPTPSWSLAVISSLPTPSISHSVSFSCKLFLPSMKSQPTLLWTDSCSWLSESAGLQNICHILQSHR